MNSGRTRRIVAGVDGSANSAAALRRAVMEARRRGAELDVVYVVVNGTDAAAADDGAAGPAAVRDGHEVLANALSAACHGGPDVPVRQRVESGVPAKVLVRASEGAELLVIGARAHSESGNLLGGHTVPYCLDHAPSPVDVCADHQAACLA